MRRSLAAAVSLVMALRQLTCGVWLPPVPLRALPRAGPRSAQWARVGFVATKLLSLRPAPTPAPAAGAAGEAWIRGGASWGNLFPPGIELGVGLPEPSCFDLERIRAVGLFWVRFRAGCLLGCISCCG